MLAPELCYDESKLLSGQRLGGQEKSLDTLSERSKLNLISIFLLLVLVFLIFASFRTFQAVHNFQRQYREVSAGDVSTMRSWMTLHAIAHLYHIPENYLYRSLAIHGPLLPRYATLSQIAAQKHQSVYQIIYSIQRKILIYRQHHRTHLTHATNTVLFSPMRGSMAD